MSQGSHALRDPLRTLQERVAVGVSGVDDLEGRLPIRPRFASKVQLTEGALGDKGGELVVPERLSYQAGHAVSPPGAAGSPTSRCLANPL